VARIGAATDGAVRVLTIDRPEKKNAFTGAMYAALTDELVAADADPAVRAIVLQGAGGAFTAGNDLQDFLASPPSGDDSPVVRFLCTLPRLATPLVAGVEGPAVGVGCTLLLHCDLVYASEDARFALPFVNLGLCPEAASSLLLPRLAGLQRASELLLLGEPFDAARAHEVGIVNEVLPRGAVQARARERARALASRPPAALRATRALVRAGLQQAVEDRLRAELRVFAERLSSPEAREAFTAFLEKRPPDFSKCG